MYYIVREDGTSVFEQPYCEDFIFHCLINLINRTNEKFYLVSFGSTKPNNISLLAVTELQQLAN